MASGNSLQVFNPQNNLSPAWAYVAFTGGSTEPSLADTIWGDTSDENGILEFLSLESGTWAGNDAAGYMLLSNLTGAVGDWTSGEDFTANSSTAGDHGTLTALPVDCFATFDTRNNKSIVDFDAASNEVAMFQGFMPRHYAGGGLTITVGWMATSATTGDTSWAIFFMSVSDDADDLDIKNFAAPNTNTTVDAPSASGEVDYFTITFTDGADMDSIAAGEMFYLLLMRDAQDSTNDDMAGDAEFVFMEIQET